LVTSFFFGAGAAPVKTTRREMLPCADVTNGSAGRGSEFNQWSGQQTRQQPRDF